MKETKYTKEDWISGKCALEWENDKSYLDPILQNEILN